MPESKVLVGTSIGTGKEYCLPFLSSVLKSLAGADAYCIVADGAEPASPTISLPPLEGDLPYYARAARPREAIRRHFQEGDWTHLYFHDCDHVPPADIIAKLLALDVPIATGIYALRGFTEPVVPAVLSWEAGPAGLLLTNLGAIRAEEATWPVQSFGMGCMLIRRDALEATPFREPAYLAEHQISEDYAWCADAAMNGFKPVQVHLEASCRHVNDDGRASRLNVGPLGAACVWIDTPHFVRNRFGEWTRGQPRFDLTPEQAKELPPGFVTTLCRQTTLEWKRLEEILP